MFPNDYQNFSNQSWGYATPIDQDATDVAPEPLDTDITPQASSSTSAALDWNQSVESQAANTTQPWIYGQLEGMTNNYGDQWPPQPFTYEHLPASVEEYAGHRGAMSFSTSSYSSLSWALGGNIYNLPFQPSSPPRTPLNNATYLSTPPYSIPAAPIPSPPAVENNGTENADSSSSSALYNQLGGSPWSASHSEPGFSASSQDESRHIVPGPPSTSGFTHVQPHSGLPHSQDWIDRGYPRMAPQPSSSNASAEGFETIRNLSPRRPNLLDFHDRPSSSVRHDIHSGMQAPSSGPIRQRANRRSNHRSSTVDDATVEELRRLEYGRGSRGRRNRNGSERRRAAFSVSRQSPHASNESSSSSIGCVANTDRPKTFHWSIAGTRNYMGDELMLPPITPSGGSSEASAYAENNHNNKEKPKRAKRSRADCKTPINKLERQEGLRRDIRRYVRNIQDVLISQFSDGLAHGRSEGDTLAALIPHLGGTSVPQRDMGYTLKEEKVAEYRRFKRACIEAVYEMLDDESGKELMERTIWEEVMRRLRDRYP